MASACGSSAEGSNGSSPDESVDPFLPYQLCAHRAQRKDRKGPKALSELSLQLSLGLGRGEAVRACPQARCMEEEEILMKGRPENKDDAPPKWFHSVFALKLS